LSDVPTTDARLILSTCASDEEARHIAGALIEARLAACVSTLPGLHSTYRWKNKIETSTEILLLIKTDAAHADRAEKLITSLHSYEVPEFLVLQVAGGSESYLRWLSEAMK
jgi:periplasmic divalent cation tolerance protein